MDFTSIDITERVFLFFETNKNYDFLIINKKLENITGIINFFKEENEVKQLYNRIESHCLELMERQEEYGDYQTNENLSLSICHRLKDKNIDPQIIIEPTCGKGNFILSSLRVFNNIEKIFAIEIQEHYLWTLKFRLIDFFIENPSLNRPQIYISNISVFDYDFSQIKNKIKDEKLLILGNPPWVTNSALSILNSTNLPRKYNIKRTKGIEAITGKSNFDIGEYIILNLLDLFSIYYGHFAFLIKNSVIKNIIYDQKINNYQIGKIEKYSIDSMKEFGASVDSSLFLCEMHNSPDYFANEGNFYDFKITNTLGWVDGKFASNITKYKKYNKSDGK